MDTLVFHQEIGCCADIIRQGGLVSVPTETVYGLAGDALNTDAVRKIYEVKGRPPVKPLSIMIRGKEDIPRYASQVPEAAGFLAEKFWPGPLTIVLKAKDVIPDIVRAGGATVGLRCPAHPLTLRLIAEADTALAAPSANLSGGKSPVCAEDVLSVFDGQIDAVIDGGLCSFQKESTLIDMSTKPFRILRHGAVSEDTIADALAGRMRIIGITGSSGAGKSSALDVYRREGAFVIDCDLLYHDMLREDAAMIAEILERFPGASDENHAVSRKKLGEIVFRDSRELEALNALTHRHITSRLRQLLRKCAMDGYDTAVIDAVELISSGISEVCDFTLAVLASREVRIQRIMQRDGIDRRQAELRVDAQKSDTYYREHCTYTVNNDEDADITSEAFRNKFINLSGEK